MSETGQMLSVVIPVYRGEPFLRELYGRVKSVAEGCFAGFELVLVNDASPDNSWALIRELCALDKRVKGINLSRNFGQHYAITAGLSASSGDWIVVMDCDLQDKPEEIANLYREAMNGYDTVFARRSVRQDSFCKRMSSKCFYRVFSYLTDTTQDAAIANFGIYRRPVINAVLSMDDHIKYFPAMAQWVGFRKSSLQVQHQARVVGGSSYTLRKLFSLAFDNIITFSDKPLKLTVKFGLLISCLAFLVALVYFISYIVGYTKVAGYMSIILSIWFLSGIIISILGMLGIYIGKIFQQVKHRPLFIVAEEVNCDGN